MDEVVLETMQSFNQYIHNIISGCDDVSELLRTNSAKEALALILQFSEGLDWIVEINEKLTNLGYENDIQVTALHQFLEAINDGLEQQDYYLVADLFEYEIKPFFEAISAYEVNN